MSTVFAASLAADRHNALIADAANAALVRQARLGQARSRRARGDHQDARYRFRPLTAFRTWVAAGEL
ncbi:MAG: hypothetical protein QOE97_3091 [Pseudonocardiales bacterium]|jgi:hypothetical protein|nr:hypothetical protein [Pseudonocardiales bacterium]